MEILIVDDGPANLRLLRAVLESDDHAVHEANDGIEALEILEKEKIELIISDILMPRMDGYRLCGEVKKSRRFRNIPFVFYTATYTSPSDRKLCLDLGADKYLVKPAPSEEILAIVQEVTSRKTRKAKTPISRADAETITKEYNESLVYKLEEKNIALTEANAELVATRNRLEHLLGHSPIVIYGLRIEGETITPHAVSENVRRFLGFEPAETLSYEWWFNQLHPDDRAHAEASIAETLAQGASRTEYRIFHRDGSLRWVDDHRRLIKDESGTPVEFVGAWSDITERKRAEEALRALNDQFCRQEQALANLTRLHVLHSGDLNSANRQITEVVARTLDVQRVSIWRYEPGRKSLLCKELFEAQSDSHSSGIVLHAKDFPSYFKALEEADVIAAHNAHADPRTAEFSKTYLTPLGINSMMDAPIHLKGSVAGVICCEHVGPCREWSSAEQTFVISVANLVSLLLSQVEQQKLEEQFRQAQKMEAIGQLAGGIAHDFNNILGAILGYTGMAQMEVSDPVVQEYLDQVNKGSRRAADLVTQILAFSRQQEQERQPAQLKFIVSEALKLLRASVPASIKFEQSLKNTPAVLANPTAIHQVVMNLGTNAWHAMRDTPGTLRVELASFFVDPDFAAAHPDLQPGSYVRLSVIDTGSGMDRATVQRIFEPFFTTKAPGEGTGLGLAAVHGIMKSHDGGITVYSQPGEGTTFHLYFPIYETQVPESTGAVQPIPRGAGERILFVDDEEPLANVGRTMLERLGYAVTTETNVLNAIQLFRETPDAFDLVITDLTMPGLDGVKFGLQLLEMRPDLRIILTTGYSGNMTQEKVRDLGFCELLLKPNTARSLGQAVHRVLG